ncbi:PREDICTED: short coiled-coil protein isoform X7 [Colobus angolensis palliatus]|uniref:short coiled-coil protein isoform X7 n=1 Tax=Colobus angolensis palliatus TaxID=336983 RepID=UPI0005F562B7|nr:PREDICTED: short coiled-coil protein isoform X7 [Colobus angolensis palliatus]
MDGSRKEEEEDSTFTNISLADDIDRSSKILYPRHKSLLPKMMNADMDDLSARVDAVKEENLKLKSENQVLGQYIENLMSASSVFQTTDTKSKRK